ncbi:MAG: hypothetical protein GY729_17195, partial [Desulfobacteraceae bacterium]|nr:hypothetical protein [Desulfobacteraceae bacterium]
MKKRTGWIACSIVLLMFGYLACNSFAAEEDKNKALSKAISQVKLFSGLTEPERDALKEVAVLKHGKPGERIIQEGQSMGRMLIILDSQAEVRIKGKLI